jgi:hypothetical protein
MLTEKRILIRQKKKVKPFLSEEKYEQLKYYLLGFFISTVFWMLIK